MPVTQLRRYQLEEGSLAAWAEHWRQNVLPLRRQFGFEVLFAYADHVNSQFVWAVSYDGDAEQLAAQERVYHDSPEWAARNKGKNGPIQRATVSIAQEIWSPLLQAGTLHHA